MKDTLIYVHDPMCSWCWGFEKVREQLFAAVSDRMQVKRLLGGLAPDSDEPMAEATRQMIQQSWQRIEQVTGTSFNFEFWSKNTPRRSTYPSNRAVIAAREQGLEFDSLMTRRIQQAYYQEARNPSDISVLTELAAEIGLDAEQFSESLTSERTQQQLMQEISTARSIGVDSFPSLVVEQGGRLQSVLVNYTNLDAMLRQIDAA